MSLSIAQTDVAGHSEESLVRQSVVEDRDPLLTVQTHSPAHISKNSKFDSDSSASTFYQDTMADMGTNL